MEIKLEKKQGARHMLERRQKDAFLPKNAARSEKQLQKRAHERAAGFEKKRALLSDKIPPLLSLSDRQKRGGL